MAPERPSFLLEQQYPHGTLHRSIWSAYGTYGSFERGRENATGLDRPCRITECRVIWRSVAIR